jgi:hypothetical protein
MFVPLHPTKMRCDRCPRWFQALAFQPATRASETQTVLSLGDDARVSSSPLRSQFPSIISNHTLCSYTNDYRTHAEPEKEKLSSNTLPPANIDKSHTESEQKPTLF